MWYSFYTSSYDDLGESRMMAVFSILKEMMELGITEPVFEFG